MAEFQTEDNDGKPLTDNGAKTASSLKLQDATVIECFSVSKIIYEKTHNFTDITVLNSVSKKSDTTRLQKAQSFYTNEYSHEANATQ